MGSPSVREPSGPRASLLEVFLVAEPRLDPLAVCAGDLGQRHGGRGRFLRRGRQESCHAGSMSSLRFSIVPLAERLLRRQPALAVLAPTGFERFVEAGSAASAPGPTPRRTRRRGRAPGGPVSPRAHSMPTFLVERQAVPLVGDHAGALVNLVGDVDLDRTDLGTRPAQRRVEREARDTFERSKPGSRITPIGPE